MANQYCENYKMDYEEKAKCLIFYNEKFDRKPDRKVAAKDEELLRECFTRLNYNVISYPDFTAKEIKTTLKKVAKEDHQNRNSLVCCFSTHGRDNAISGRDTIFPVEKFYEYFKANECPSLAGKPKMFFIQACQGKRTDEGHFVESTDGNSSFKICSYSDFLIGFSSAPMTQLVSFNRSSGSWFIQALCNVLNKNANCMDLLSMLTIVNNKICLDFESRNEEIEDYNKKKQVSCIVSTLIKKVYFKIDKEDGEN